MKTQGTGENDDGGGRKRENGRVDQMKKGTNQRQNAGYRMFHSIYNLNLGHRVKHEAPPGQPECELRFWASGVSDKSDVQDTTFIFC